MCVDDLAPYLPMISVKECKVSYGPSISVKGRPISNKHGVTILVHLL